MNPLSIIVMVLFASVSFLLIRSLAPFEKTSKLKYISLNNKFLANCLIPKQKGYVKVNDRKKISLFSCVFYLLFVFLVLTLVVMFVLPDIPCKPFIGRFGRAPHITRWEINTFRKRDYAATFRDRI